jgi:probable HAF family extracellular repeat protein
MHVARTNKANLLKVWLVALGVARGLVALALLMGAQPVFGQSVSGQRVGAQKLSITDLGTLGGDYVHSMATDINSRGQVVGDSVPARSDKFRAFLWEDGKMTNLGSLPGSSEGSIATGINNRGQVVGYSGHADSGTNHAVLWTK